MDRVSGKSERSAGLDLLRILSMFLILTLHILGRGGVLEHTALFSWNYYLAWAMETAAYCAVDCYALLSGYLLCGSRCRPEGLIRLWMQVFFWSAVLTALFALFYESVPAARILKSCLPVLSGQYWYFTAYFAVYCFAPFFNRLIAGLSRDAFRRLVGTGFVLLSLLPALTGEDPFVTGKGYSFLWLAALYFAGAFLRRFPPESPRRNGLWLGGYLLCVVAAFFGKYLLEHLSYARTGAAAGGGRLVSYTSPFIVGAAVCLLLWCRGLTLRSGWARGLIGFFAPASFGVYLIHAEPFVYHRLLAGTFSALAAWPAAKLVGGTVLAALGIFLICSLAERLRLLLFRLVGLDTAAAALGAALERRIPEA